MLRPVDVIFKHPIKKFTVIYQNGTLWQLPRLEFDGKTLLLYKELYTDSREHIFVASDQTLNPNDELLLSQLLTIHLPDSIIGRNVNQFEHWWQYNWYNFKDEIELKRQRQQHAKEMVRQSHLALDQGRTLVNEQNQLPPQLIHDITNPQKESKSSSVSATAQISTQANQSISPMPKVNMKDYHDDFDRMLDDLTNL